MFGSVSIIAKKNRENYFIVHCPIPLFLVVRPDEEKKQSMVNIG